MILCKFSRLASQQHQFVLLSFGRGVKSLALEQGCLAHPAKRWYNSYKAVFCFSFINALTFVIIGNGYRG